MHIRKVRRETFVRGDVVFGKAYFFERMERDIDFHQEYLKIEEIVLNEPEYQYGGYPTINDEISRCFRSWEGRGNYTSFQELRQHLGFGYYKAPKTAQKYIPNGKVTGIDDFLLYCEMLLNMFVNLRDRYANYGNKERAKAIIDTMVYDFELINHEINYIEDNRVIIVQKNTAASAVADIVEPDLGDAIIKYNHHLLKGDLEGKKDILKKIADAIEPKRSDLKIADKIIENNFFYMVNNMNIRHNNCDSSDTNRYNSKFASLSSDEKEEWYDLIYQEGLMAFLSLEKVKINTKIEAFKKL